MTRNHLYFISDNFGSNFKVIFRNLLKYFRDFFSISFLINPDFRKHFFVSLIGINDYFLKEEVKIKKFILIEIGFQNFKELSFLKKKYTVL